MASLLAVFLTEILSKCAASKSIFFVFSSTFVLSPPIIPAIAIGFLSSAIIRSPSFSSLSSPSNVFIFSPSFASLT